MGELTNIRITKKTRTRLAQLGKKGETWDQLINRLIDLIQEKQKQ